MDDQPLLHFLIYLPLVSFPHAGRPVARRLRKAMSAAGDPMLESRDVSRCCEVRPQMLRPRVDRARVKQLVQDAPVYHQASRLGH